LSALLERPAQPRFNFHLGTTTPEVAGSKVPSCSNVGGNARRAPLPGNLKLGLGIKKSTRGRNAAGGYMQFGISMRNQTTKRKWPATVQRKLLVLSCLLTILPVIFGQGNRS
jgi:hypothetical protein